MAGKLELEFDHEELVLFIFKDNAFMLVQPAQSWNIDEHTTLCDHVEIMLAELGDSVVGYGTMRNMAGLMD
jgi:hypothetical protein